MLIDVVSKLGTNNFGVFHESCKIASISASGGSVADVHGAAIDLYNAQISKLVTFGTLTSGEATRNVKVTDKKAAQDDADVQAAVKAVGEALGDTGRILVRESGTEPLVRVMVEAPEHETCEKYVQQVVDVIKAKGYAF